MQYVVRSDSIKLYIAYNWLCTKNILNTCLLWNRNCLIFPEHMRSLPVLLGFVLLNHQLLCTIQWTSFRNCSLSYFIFYPFHFLCTMLMLQRVVLGKCLPIYVRLIILDLSFDYMSLIFNRSLLSCIIVIKTQISNTMCTACSWNNLRLSAEGWKIK